MDATSEMKLVGYRVHKINFELNNDFEFSNKRVEINPKFSRKIQKVDESTYIVWLKVSIKKECQENVIPFFAEIELSAKFFMQNWEEADKKECAITNATAILFPYLRNLLSNVTMNGNIPPYLLPIMNVEKLFKDIV